MLNLKRAVIPGIAGVTIGALLLGAYVTQSGPSTTALAAPTNVSPAATSSRSTSFQVVNMGTATATAVVKFYDQKTQSILQNYQPSQSLAPGGSMLLDQRNDTNITSGFAGSAVAESSQKLGAIVNEFAADGGTDGYNAVASDEVGLTAICPVALGNVSGQGGKVFNTIIHVQGAGTAASTVTAKFINSSGTTVKTSNLSVQAGASQSIVLETDSALRGFFGAVVLTSSDQPIAAAAEQYTSQQLIDYTCFGAGATTVYAPAIFNFPGFYRTSTVVSNFGTSQATVQFQFTDPADSNKNVTFSDTIPAQSAKVYDQGFDNGGKTPIASGFFGGLKLTSDQPVAIVVQELSNGDIQGLAYRGISEGQLSQKVVLPSIFSGIIDGSTGINFNTSFAVMNPNSTAATLNMTFTPIGGGASQTLNGQTVPANGTKLFEQRNIAGANTAFATAGNFGSVTIQSDQKIGVIVNELISKEQEANAAQYKDPVIGYNGIPSGG